MLHSEGARCSIITVPGGARTRGTDSAAMMMPYITSDASGALAAATIRGLDLSLWWTTVSVLRLSSISIQSYSSHLSRRRGRTSCYLLNRS